MEEWGGDWRGSTREGSKNKRGIVVGSERVPKGKGSVCKGRKRRKCEGRDWKWVGEQEATRKKKKGSCGGEDEGVLMI